MTTTNKNKKYEEINKIKWNIIILKSFSYMKRCFEYFLYTKETCFSILAYFIKLVIKQERKLCFVSLNTNSFLLTVSV